MSLAFYEKSHRYKLDGKWCPGVTTLIKGGLPAPALMYWSARSVAEWVADNKQTLGGMYGMGRGPMVAALKEIPWQKRDEGAAKGTEIHALAERLGRGDEVEVPERLSGYVDACVAFLDEWKPTPIIVERPLAHRADWWCGKPDMFADLPDGRRGLFDFKTAGSGVWPETAWQLAAYSHAEFYVDVDENEQPIPAVDLCAAVHLTPDGYEVLPVKADDDVYAEFLHMAAVSAAAKRGKGTKTEMGYIGLPLNPPGTAA